jgi:hypothetical protein
VDGEDLLEQRSRRVDEGGGGVRAGVVDHDVEPTETVHGELDDLARGLLVRDVVATRDGLPPGLLDLAHHLLGGSERRACRAVRRPPEVVHDDLRPPRGQ